MASLRPGRELTSFLVLLLFASFFQSGCLVRRRVVTPQGQKTPRPLLSATKPELIQRLHQIYDPIQSFTIKADMSPSIGSLYGGKVTDYPTVTGYILFLRPDTIRVIGLDPVIHSTAFDMVSTGNDFKVSIPVKSAFIEGRNDAPATSNNKLENLRPSAFLNALLIRPPDPATDITVLEDDTDETRAVYMLMMLGREGDHYYPLRNVYFDRYTLQINRQRTFDKEGGVVSETRYSNWKAHNGVLFPSTIDIQRPKDGYEVVLDLTDMKVNTGDLTAEKFELKQPPGSKLKQLE